MNIGLEWARDGSSFFLALGLAYAEWKYLKYVLVKLEL